MNFFNLHTHHYTKNENILELVNQYPHEFDDTIPFYSIGIHPWYLVENRVESGLEIIERKLQEPNCLALGECGLDKRIEIPMDLQQQVFEKQLALAQKYKKPIVVHCVAAFDELIVVVKKLKISVPIIIHGFSKNAQVAKQLLDNGFYLSFGKYLLQNPDLETVFKNIPNDRFFLETDIMTLNLEQVYDLAAKQKEISIAEIQKQINVNFDLVFRTDSSIVF
jgi:TatD DNase family protein